MNELLFHPISEIFPLMDSSDIDTLAEDIRTSKQQEPITLYEEKILDGRNRYLACRKADVEPVTCVFDGKDPLAFVISLNLHRRHLDAPQRASVADKIANLRWGQKKPKEISILPKSIQNISTKSVTYEDSGIPLSSVKIAISQPDAAKIMNVSVDSVKQARIINNKGTPNVKKALDDGKLSLRKGVKIVKESPEKQEKFLEEVLSPTKPTVTNTKDDNVVYPKEYNWQCIPKNLKVATLTKEQIKVIAAIKRNFKDRRSQKLLSMFIEGEWPWTVDANSSIQHHTPEKIASSIFYHWDINKINILMASLNKKLTSTPKEIKR